MKLNDQAFISDRGANLSSFRGRHAVPRAELGAFTSGMHPISSKSCKVDASYVVKGSIGVRNKLNPDEPLEALPLLQGTNADM